MPSLSKNPESRSGRREVCFSTPWIEVLAVHPADGDGEPHYAISTTDYVSIVALDPRGRVVLVQQYRLPAGKQLWELPAGKIDPGENALQAAKRELSEETGYKAKSWKKLASFWASPGFLAEKMTIYLATELQAGVAAPMGDERIEARWFSSKEMDALIQEGKIEDGKTMIGYLTWKRFHAATR